MFDYAVFLVQLFEFVRTGNDRCYIDSIASPANAARRVFWTKQKAETFALLRALIFPIRTENLIFMWIFEPN